MSRSESHVRDQQASSTLQIVEEPAGNGAEENSGHHHQEAHGGGGGVGGRNPPQLMLFRCTGDPSETVRGDLMNVATEEEYSGDTQEGYAVGGNMILEQDRFLPIANIARIMKRVIPNEGKVAKDAKECCQECVSEFISFITSEASERCLHEKRKTINGEDLLYAMQNLGFDNYIDPLKIYLAKYRDAQKGEKTAASSGIGGIVGALLGGSKAEDMVHVGAANQPGSIALQVQGNMYVDPTSGQNYVSISTPNGPQLVPVVSSTTFEQASHSGDSQNTAETEQEED